MALQAKTTAKAKPLSKEKLAELRETKAQKAVSEAVENEEVTEEQPVEETVPEEESVPAIEETQTDDVPFWMEPGYDWYNDKRWEQYEEAREYWLIHLT